MAAPKKASATTTAMTTPTSIWRLEDMDSTNWKLRDMAHLLMSRHGWYNGSNIQEQQSKQKQKQSSLSTSIMPMSCHFDSDACLTRIKREKANIVSRAFDASAFAIIKAVIKAYDPKTDTDDDNNDDEDDSDDDDDDDSNDDDDTEDEDDEGNYNRRKGKKKKGNLPTIINQWNEIEELRIISMDRANKNKDYAKNIMKKGSKDNTAVNAIVSSSSTGGRGGASKKGGSTATTGSTSGTGTKQKKGAGSAKKNSNKDGAPKFTRNTPASSAAALDSRSTSSRAILCAAGNVAFNALTPPFKPSQVIDVVAVPQNPNKAAAATTAENDNNSSSNATVMPNVNMGAVSIEAQTLGQRAISVANNSVRRACRRYQYRKDNIQFSQKNNENMIINKLSLFQLKNPFAWATPTKQKNIISSSSSDDNSSIGSEEGRRRSGDADELMDIDSIMEKIKNNREYAYQPNEESITEFWTDHCLKRFINILQTGAGHAIYHDVSWFTRHGRIANLLYELSIPSSTANSSNNNNNFKGNYYGPHLIITTEPEVKKFAQEFHYVNSHMRLLSTTKQTKTLRALPYEGEPIQRKKIREFFFILDAPESGGGGANNGVGIGLSGLPGAPFHVLITSYSSFLQDYIHFCQIPFEVVIVDDGVAFMSCAASDPNSPLGHVWENAMWSTKDQRIGLAGTSYSQNSNGNSANKKNNKWDFSLGGGENNEIPQDMIKDAWIGLTSRHRILTSSRMKVQQRNSTDLVPVSGLVNFVAPHFADVVREEWDRSRIHTDSVSMEHFRKLLTRSTIVHYERKSVLDDCNMYVYDLDEDDDDDDQRVIRMETDDGDRTKYFEYDDDNPDLHLLALAALKGKLPTPNRSLYDGKVPEVIPDEVFVRDGKVAYSRRSSLVWLGTPLNISWLRYELGISDVKPILDAMNNSNTHGHFCEEIITASSTTSSGVAGQVTGTLAYRLAVRCCRHFGSEQGLRQHLSAVHAPPGTWLCRTCGIDCITSQSRTHHERSCGQPSGAVTADQIGSAGGAGANSTVGKGGGGGQSGRQHHHGPVGVVGKKKGQRVSASQTGGTGADDKDPDGSFRVPGYRGVWVNQAGKHFVKIDGKRLLASESKSAKATEGDNNDTVLFFDNIDEAAREHDEVITSKHKGNKKADETGKAKVQLNFKSDGTRIIYEDVTPASTTGLGGSASNVVPALSVINIKDLPPDVKPLLRDPRQTSRTGSNSKRHVYAYRGVCRQARKGHDRWQSQISFMGVNHYLGTFDSEWDAAAIYAWAHLILYGEEATKKAQKEGEEAAAAYEQEKKDIAAGKIPPPPAKPEKKKKKPAPKKKKDIADDDNNEGKGSVATGTSTSKKRKNAGGSKGEGDGKSSASGENKKAKAVPKVDKEAIAPTLAKGVTKTTVLAPRDDVFKDKSDEDIIESVAQRLDAVHESRYWCVSSSANSSLRLASTMDDRIRPCLPVSSMSSIPGGAMLVGLSPFLSGWDLEDFLDSRPARTLLDGITLDGSDDVNKLDIEGIVKSTLVEEFGHNGFNEQFRTLVLGTGCIIGSASKRTRRAYESLGLGAIPIGGAVGEIDCHIGGTAKSCSEATAYIQYAPTSASEFQFSSISPSDREDYNRMDTKDMHDIVTWNGQRITADMGSFPLSNEDICTVGGRVFVFLLPVDK